MTPICSATDLATSVWLPSSTLMGLGGGAVTFRFPAGTLSTIGAPPIPEVGREGWKTVPPKGEVGCEGWKTAPPKGEVGREGWNPVPLKIAVDAARENVRTDVIGALPAGVGGIEAPAPCGVV